MTRRAARPIPTCPHCGFRLDCLIHILTCDAAVSKKHPAAVALGSIKSPKKAASSRENGKKGGRPPKPKPTGAAESDTQTVASTLPTRLRVGTFAFSSKIFSRPRFLLDVEPNG